MPRQISKEEFLNLAEGARECLVVKRKGRAKLKLRRSRMLYTLIVDEDEADELLKKVKVSTIEL